MEGWGSKKEKGHWVSLRDKREANGKVGTEREKERTEDMEVRRWEHDRGGTQCIIT